MAWLWLGEWLGYGWAWAWAWLCVGVAVRGRGRGERACRGERSIPVAKSERLALEIKRLEFGGRDPDAGQAPPTVASDAGKETAPGQVLA